MNCPYCKIFCHYDLCPYDLCPYCNTKFLAYGPYSNLKIVYIQFYRGDKAIEINTEIKTCSLFDEIKDDRGRKLLTINYIPEDLNPTTAALWIERLSNMVLFR